MKMENSSQAVEIISKLLTPITETCILKKNELIAYYIYVCVCVCVCTAIFYFVQFKMQRYLLSPSSSLLINNKYEHF